MSDFNLKDGVSKAYGLYAMSVIKGRALPDIRDGLKPVQRRILYAMLESGNKYNKPHKKSVKIVGEVMGNYHPHGDSSIYGAMVHLAQEFTMSVPLVDKQGNFGSIDGDNAASMRYTEARLKQISENHLLQDCEKDTVPLRFNFDETLTIPSVLPAQFPNLLINGSNGIAVGMATSIPPHNLGEVLDGVCAMMDNEDIILEELMVHIKGPDFPTHGAFFGGPDLKSGYQTGRGKVILRGSCFVEDFKQGRQAIIIDSIPHQVLKPKIIEQISTLVTEGVLSEISDMRDESGKNIRVVIELKKDANAEIIMQRIFAKTSLQVSVSMNMVAIHEDKPITFSLIKVLQIFLQFREDVVIKRAKFILNKALDKAHIVWGLVLATTRMDEIIATIRSSHDDKESEQRLIAMEWSRADLLPIFEILDQEDMVETPYHFSLEQVRGILDLRLKKLTKLEQASLLNSLKELSKITKEQTKIINDRTYRKEIMKGEFRFLKEKFAVPRRTQQLATLGDLSEASLVEKEDIVVMLTTSGYVKRINLEEYRLQHRGGKGKIGHRKQEDPILNLFMMNTLTDVLFFTSKGKVHAMKAYQIPVGSANSRGRCAINLFDLDKDEIITTVLPLEDMQEGYLAFVTKNGTVRRNRVSDFMNIRSNGKIAMKFEDGDNSLHSVFHLNEEDELLLSSSNGNAIRFAISDIRVFESRSSQGVRAMQLGSDDFIIGATKIEKDTDCEILCITKKGYGKRSKFSEYRRIKRGGKGSKSMNINKKTGTLTDALHIEKGDEILLMTKKGQTIRVSIDNIRKTARVTSGVIIMKLPAEDFITQVVRIAGEDHIISE